MTREEAIEYFKKILAGARQGLEKHPEVGKRVYGMRKELAEIALTALRPVSREQVEKMWKGDWEHAHKTIVGNFSIVRCSKCGHEAFEKALYVTKGRFCPVCGAAITDEAVQMVMKRLEAIR